MSMIERLRRRFPRIPEMFPRLPKGPIISVIGLGSQRYDPELAVIDPGSLELSRRRLSLGYGAPPVVPYGQRIDRGLRRRVLQTFPALNQFPMVKRMLEA